MGARSASRRLLRDFPILRFPVFQPMVLFIERFGWPERLL